MSLYIFMFIVTGINFASNAQLTRKVMEHEVKCKNIRQQVEHSHKNECSKYEIDCENITIINN